RDVPLVARREPRADREDRPARDRAESAPRDRRYRDRQGEEVDSQPYGMRAPYGLPLANVRTGHRQGVEQVTVVGRPIRVGRDQERHDRERADDVGEWPAAHGLLERVQAEEDHPDDEA